MTNRLNVILTIFVYDYSNIVSNLVVFIFHKALIHKNFAAMKYRWICIFFIFSESPSLNKHSLSISYISSSGRLQYF